MQNPPEKPPIPKPPKPPKPPKQFPGLNTSKSDKTTPEASKKITPNQMRGTANAMMIMGFLIMTSVLLGYKTTVCETTSSGYEYDCTHNIGEIGKKNNLIMYSGFLFLGGCVLLNNDECKK